MTSTATRTRGKSSLLNYNKTLPEGVVVIKDYRAGYSLCECLHDSVHQRPLSGWCAVTVGTNPPETIETPVKTRKLSGKLNEKQARALLRDTEGLDYYGRLTCMACMADEDMSDAFRRPVKFLAVVHSSVERSAAQYQTGLF